MKTILLIILSLFTAASAFADPSVDDIKSWLHDKKVVLEKRWYWSNKTLVLKSYALTDIKILKSKETFKVKPWEQNLGTAWVRFNHKDDNGDFTFEGVFQYTFEGAVLREKSLESVMIERR